MVSTKIADNGRKRLYEQSVLRTRQPMLSQHRTERSETTSHTYSLRSSPAHEDICVRRQLVPCRYNYTGYKPKRGVGMSNLTRQSRGTHRVLGMSPESKSHRTRTPRLTWPKIRRGILSWPKSELTLAKIYVGLRTILLYCPKSSPAGLPLGVPSKSPDMDYNSLSELREACPNYSSESEYKRWKPFYLASESEQIPSESYTSYYLGVQEGPGLGLGSPIRGPEGIRTVSVFGFLKPRFCLRIGSM